jgi:hypothetical protein
MPRLSCLIKPQSGVGWRQPTGEKPLKSDVVQPPGGQSRRTLAFVVPVDTPDGPSTTLHSPLSFLASLFVSLVLCDTAAGGAEAVVLARGVTSDSKPDPAANSAREYREGQLRLRSAIYRQKTRLGLLRSRGPLVGVCLHQRLATVGGPIPTFDVTADGSIGRSTAIPRPCKQQSVAFCVRHWSFGRSQ